MVQIRVRWPGAAGAHANLRLTAIVVERLIIERRDGTKLLSNEPSSDLLWLDAENEVADSDLLIGQDFGAFFAREFASPHHRWVAALGNYPVSPVVVA